VLHPALPDDPGHALWKRDFTGACGLFGVVLKPASQRAVHAFLDALEIFGLGFSWGGYESLAIHCDPQLKNRAVPAKLEGPLLRLHIGLESPADLIIDLERGFTALAAQA
jgi:cystathionine beta-lyase